eukprot:182364-Alexandrium_andersonii.AAC.1
MDGIEVVGEDDKSSLSRNRTPQGPELPVNRAPLLSAFGEERRRPTGSRSPPPGRHLRRTVGGPGRLTC